MTSLNMSLVYAAGWLLDGLAMDGTGQLIDPDDIKVAPTSARGPGAGGELDACVP
jgi:hypothetical protein